LAANRILAMVFALIIGGLLYLLLTRTRYGTALRAIAVNPVAAQLSGIDIAAASALAFAAGGAIVGAGGVLVSMFLTFSAASGVVFTMKALIVVIMGGVGNMLGALIALGLTLQYGIARIMNLSYGEFLVAAAFGALFLYTGMAVNPVFGLLLVVPVSFAANWLLYRVVLTPLVKRARNQGMLEVDSILGTFGVLFVIQGLMQVVFGGSLQSYSYLSVPVHILGTTLALNRILALLFAVVIGGVLYLFLTRTRYGTALRAIAVNPDAARLSGIDIHAASALAFAAGGAIVGAGGVLVSMFLTFSAAMGVVFTMKALIVVIMGGVGNMLGALIAGLLIGISETAVARLIDPGLTIAVTYALFLSVLLWRPTGLFGRAAR
jgi:branched-chain amino acid transport system permease protein